MNKVKVSRKLKDALDNVKETKGFIWLMKVHCEKKIRGEQWLRRDFKIFNDLNVHEMFKILENGYELEETKEQKIYKMFRIGVDNVSSPGSYRCGVIDTLEILGIEIKGVNK